MPSELHIIKLELARLLEDCIDQKTTDTQIEQAVEPIHDALAGELRDPLVEEVLWWLQWSYSDTRTTYLVVSSEVAMMLRRVVLFLRSGLPYVESTNLPEVEIPRGCLLCWSVWILPGDRRLEQVFRARQKQWYARAANPYWPFLSEEQYTSTVRQLQRQPKGEAEAT